MGLLDQLQSFGQGASNSAASTVTAPVDGLAWLLRKMGVPVPSDPVGGSDWAAKQGLTATPKNHIAGLLGEAFGGVAPMVAAAKAPQIAKGLLQAEANAMAPRTLNPQTGAIVWHGSPHKFDKFDSSKIGTGEGAQAYGHGLYLAESPDVAKSYQTALSADRGFSFGGKDGLTRAEVQDLVNAKYGGGYLDGVIRPSGVADSFIDDVVTGTLRPDGAMPRQYKPGSDRARVYNELRGQLTQTDPGTLYKVDLPDEQIAKMLDWDKPLSEQPHVLKALGRLGIPASPTLTGEELIRGSLLKGLSNYDGIVIRGEEALRSKGIPGIRYLDGGSRGAGQGSSNFVVFPGNEGLLSILERNGQQMP